MEEEFNEKFASDENVGRWHVPILAMTADVSEETYQKCRKCGMDGYVAKPFNEAQLYSAVSEFFEPKFDGMSHTN